LCFGPKSCEDVKLLNLVCNISSDASKDINNSASNFSARDWKVLKMLSPKALKLKKIKLKKHKASKISSIKTINSKKHKTEKIISEIKK
jgi:hypothetical protein